ncbi:MAG: GNAT family N-acetyltransferase [Desulfobacterales bacterium]|nr:GNAT family N-acetyltransferase [Desulfobacterales bacterium]
MDIIIKHAIPADAKKLTDIAFAAKRHWNYPEAWITRWTDELTITPRYITNHEIYIAECDDIFTGFYAAVSAEKNTWEVDHLWILPAYMGRGIGKILFKHAVRLIQSNNGHLLKIVSDPNAEGFYLKMGAIRIGEFPSKPEGRVLPLLHLKI